MNSRFLSPSRILQTSGIVLALAAHFFGQQAANPQTQTQPPAANVPVTATFKTQSDLVLVPVVVLQKGKRLSGLSKESFTLEENGKPQIISSFEEVLPAASSTPLSPAPDRGFSNVAFNGSNQSRLVILVLDLLNTTILQRSDGRDDLLKLLSKSSLANQPVALLCMTNKGLKLVQPYTTDTAALVRSLKSFPLGPETIMALENRLFLTIAMITEIAQAYSGVPGRKTMIFATQYLPEIVQESGIRESTLYAEGLHRMWRSLINSNIAVYVVRLMDWARNPARGGVGMRSIDFAEATGGNLCVEANALLDCLTQAVEDSRSYYMLGFVVPPDDRKPGWRDLKVKVSAEHADVRARTGFYFREPPSNDPKAVHDEIIGALASSVGYSSVPMFVNVVSPSGSNDPPHAAAGAKTTVEFLVTIPVSGINIDSLRSYPLDLQVGVIALTRDVREQAEFSHDVRGAPSPENLEAWARDGIKIQEKLDLPAGSYDLRFFVRDNNAGRIGTVVFPQDVK